MFVMVNTTVKTVNGTVDDSTLIMSSVMLWFAATVLVTNNGTRKVLVM